MMNEKDYKIHANKDTSHSNPVRRGPFEDPC